MNDAFHINNRIRGAAKIIKAWQYSCIGRDSNPGLKLGKLE